MMCFAQGKLHLVHRDRTVKAEQQHIATAYHLLLLLTAASVNADIGCTGQIGCN